VWLELASVDIAREVTLCTGKWRREKSFTTRRRISLVK
jgi:hypothetical protein